MPALAADLPGDQRADAAGGAGHQGRAARSQNAGSTHEATVGKENAAGLPGNYAVSSDGNQPETAPARTAGLGTLRQAVPQRVGGGVGPAAGPDLAVQVGGMPLHGVRAQPQATGDLGVGLPGGHEP